jgi:methyltransferase-like protein/SAM-dependent methyltransferase
MQRSGRPKQPSRGKQVDAELSSTGTGTAPQESAPDESQLAVRAYDEFPYESYSFPLTHPERLATIATLFGMQPAPAATSRVLELGCGAGGNLIPMALSMPGATFTGYDLSGVQVQQARDTIQALDLHNIKVEQRNILDVGSAPDKFDYLICHGVFSWVPENVQEKILSICRETLSENGVALVSYNTYPGWHMRESIRGMMRYHARQFDDPKTQVTQSRALLDFLVKSVNSEKNPYGMYLAGELKLLSSTADSYIAHEHLEHWNAPAYFHQFVERLVRHDLQYLGEAEFSTMVVKNFAAPIAETLSKGIRDVIRMEQYMDFIRNRTFRSTLLCHRERQLDRNVDSARVTRLHVAAGVEPVDAKADVRSVQQEAFKTLGGIQFQTTAPLTKAAIRILSAAWPRAVPFADLLASAQRLIGAAGASAGAEAGQRLAADVLQLYAANAVELRSIPSSFVTSVSEKPRTSALVRLQASQGARVTNLRHESLRVNDVERRTLALLDGSRERQEVIEQLVAAVLSGELSLKRGDQPITDPADRLEQVGRFYDQLLPSFGKKALLVA